MHTCILLSCLTGGLWASAGAYDLQNGWCCKNSIGSMESSGSHTVCHFLQLVLKMDCYNIVFSLVNKRIYGRSHFTLLT